jgi:hypothetical protein
VSFAIRHSDITTAGRLCQTYAEAVEQNGCRRIRQVKVMLFILTIKCLRAAF